MQAVTKCNRLLKCATINGGGRFIYRGGHITCLAKSIYGGRRFIYVGGQKMSASENGSTEVVKNIRIDKSFTKADIYKAPASKNQAQPANKQELTTCLDYIMKT
jgi:hypothetical protein